MDSEIAANQCLKHRIRCQNYCRLLMHCSLVGSRGRFASAMAILATSSLVYIFVSILCRLELYDWCWCGWKCICLMSVMAPCFLCLAELWLWLWLWLAGWLAGPWHNGSANGWASPSLSVGLLLSLCHHCDQMPGFRIPQTVADWAEESSHCGNGSLKSQQMLLKICSSQPSQDIHHTLQLTRYNSQLTSYLNTLTHMTHITTYNSQLTSYLSTDTH